jgi:hypothetical protein
MVLRWSQTEKNISWSDKLNRLGHFTKLPWDLEVFSQSVESWRMFGFKLVRTGCGTLKIQFRWKLNCRSKCLELPRRNLRIKYSHDRKKIIELCTIFLVPRKWLAKDLRYRRRFPMW